MTLLCVCVLYSVSYDADSERLWWHSFLPSLYGSYLMMASRPHGICKYLHVFYVVQFTYAGMLYFVKTNYFRLRVIVPRYIKLNNYLSTVSHDNSPICGMPYSTYDIQCNQEKGGDCRHAYRSSMAHKIFTKMLHVSNITWTNNKAEINRYRHAA